jgi:hypothetical protein
MSGNVGGRGDYDAIKENTAAINTADKNRASDSLKIKELFTRALVQLRILNVHQEIITDNNITEKDLEHTK